MFRKLNWACLLLIAFVCLTQVSCDKGDASGTNGHANAATDDIKEDDRKDRAKDLIPVEVTFAKTGTISSYILLSSNLETERMTDIYPRVQGIVEKIFAEEGENVKKNQALLKLEPDEFALEEARAEVEYRQEQSRFDRAQAMFQKDLLSNEEFEQSRFALDAKRILWEKAQLNLDYTTITSPISGVIGERLVRPGDRIQPTDKLFTVINTDEMIAVVYVPEKELRSVRKGQKAFVTSQYLPDEEFEAWIKRVSPVVDPQSGTIKVTIGIRNSENKLRPGMFINAHIITDTHEDAVLIPKTAIVYENDRLNVFVVRDSLARKVQLDVGYEDYENVESLSGIAGGERIIVVGQAGLKDQAQVKIVAERPVGS